VIVDHVRAAVRAQHQRVFGHCINTKKIMNAM
jgi:hypothetical protein